MDRRGAMLTVASMPLLAMENKAAGANPDGIESPVLQDAAFRVAIDPVTGAITAISHADDPSAMNWVCSETNAPWAPSSARWGLGFADLGPDAMHRGRWSHTQSQSQNADGKHLCRYQIGALTVEVTRRLVDGGLEERYSFINRGTAPLPMRGRGAASLAICTPFNDNYTNAADVIDHRCHAHVWTGGASSWVAMLRMGGRGPHLGMVLTSGSLAGYSIEDRDLVTLSNSRGTFLLHPVIDALAPGERAEIAWQLFWHDGWDDFFRQAGQRSQQMVAVDAAPWVSFPGEAPRFHFAGSLGSHPRLVIDGEAVPLTRNKGEWQADLPHRGPGEIHGLLHYGDGLETRFALHRSPDLDALMAARARFITGRQQWLQQGDASEGAYLVYDNEMQAMARFEHASDRNDGRERMGMGVFLARWLRQKGSGDAAIRASLDRYYRFVTTQLQRPDGFVRDGSGRDVKRLYNWPWVIQLHLAMARLTAAPACWDGFMLTLENFYAEGGEAFYPIGLPILEGLRGLKAAGRDEDHRRALALFARHGQRLIERGTAYPASEVNYEQSIVAPAAIILLELHLAAGDAAWLAAPHAVLPLPARPHVALLDLFEGQQPDHRLNGLSIRHWDGYWFGKARMWGDTFPHYWSSLNALAWKLMARATGDKQWESRAEKVIRGNLSLFAADGQASSAYIYPVTVNGRPGGFADAYANDQDWALVHALQLLEI